MSRYAAPLFVVAVLLGQSAGALDCTSPTLRAASGVIGQKHQYKIAGTCSGSSGFGANIFAPSFSYEGSASWDRVTGEARQKLRFSGNDNATGARVAVAKCSQDPFLRNPPGGTAQCGPVTVQVEMQSGKIHAELIRKEFWAPHSIALAEAQALSGHDPDSAAQNVGAAIGRQVGASASGTGVGAVAGAAASLGTSTPARPRRSQVQAMAEAAGVARPRLLELEAEALAKAARIVIAGGQVQVQPMGGFGGGWSGGEQLFWHGGAVGAVLDLVVDVPAASKYAVEIYLTRAPDYGKLSFEVDGQPSAMTFNGSSPAVAPSGPFQLGTFALQAGQRKVSLMIVGKDADSTGYFAGIDKLRLYPAGAIE
ncbi:MAG: hypothetical protein EPO25_14995 [Gammaproteobacteria bacterium]|nr:MAG: hypothetical protein EPO25_14995 [Gammaproteobacteria bacterium]